MIILLFITMPIHTSGMTACSALDQSQTTVLPFDQPTQVFEMTYDNPFHNNQGITNFGIWMKWQPRIHQKDTEIVSMSCQEQFIYSLERKVGNKALLFLYQIKQINTWEEKFKLGLKSHYFKSNELAVFDYASIEGVWIFFQVLYDEKKQEISFIFYHYELKEKQEIKQAVDLPFNETLIHKIGGIVEEIIFDGQKICFSKFLGRISSIFLFQNEDSYENLINDCYKILDDCKESKLLLIESYRFKGIEFLSFQTFVLEKNIYSIYGWFRMDYDQQKTGKQSLLQITNDFNQNSESFQNSIELQFQIYHENQQAEINFVSFQYNMQSGIPTLFDNSFKHESYFLAFQLWHYIRVDIGIPSNKAVFQLFSSQLSEEISINLETNSYTGIIKFVSVGGNSYNQNYYSGQIQNLELESFCKVEKKEFIPKCHYSCFECKGPLKTDCISCEVSYYRFLQNNQCECQYKTIDIGKSQCFNLVDYQGNFLELELECNRNGYDICQEDQQIQCSFGYFYYKNKCIQCPYYDEEKYLKQIQCLNCLLFPENFSITLECNEDAYAFEYDQQNTYNIQKREQNQITYFEIISTQKGTFDLQELLNEKNPDVIICKNGQYLIQNKCFPCQDGCDQCNQFQQCNTCKLGFYLDENKNCMKCNQGCESCKMKYDQQVCQVCLNEFYLNFEQKCKPCGQYCADCNKNGFCNYCKDPSKYFISLDGINCLPCDIKGCQFCYQLFNKSMSSLKINQLYPNLQTFDEFQTTIYCSKCQADLVLNILENKCVIVTSSEICLFGNSVNQQFQCLSNDFFIALNNCNNYKYCERCTNNQCIQCIQGYYLDEFSFQCFKCFDNCQICLQQHQIFQDAWKNNIFSFHFYQESIGSFTSLYKGIINSTYKEDYEIICIQCQSGYIKYKNSCIKGCNEDCEVCEVINSEAVCIKCKQYQGKQIRSLDSEGQCLQCPDHCAACYESNLDTLNLRNKEFIINNSNKKYLRKCFQTQNEQNGLIYLNTYFQSAIKCQNQQKCQQKVIFEWNLKCSPSIQIESHINSVYNIDEFFNKQIFLEIENEELYTFFNELNVQEIEYVINLISNDQTICHFPQNVSFTSFFVKNVFSLLQIKFKIIGKNQITQLSSTDINIEGFNQIELINLKFQSTIFQFQNEFESLIIFSDCKIQSQQDDHQLNFQLISKNNYNLYIRNFEIQNCVFKELNIFQFEVTETKLIPQITIQYLQIIESKFINTNFLYFKTQIESKNLDLQLANLIFKQSSLYNSSIIYSDGNQILTATITDFKMNQFYLTESSFFYIKNIKDFVLKDGEIVTGSFNKNSNFILSNQFKGYHIVFENIQIYNSGLLNNNFTQIQQVTTLETIYIILENVQIKNSSYNNSLSILQQVSKEYQFIIVNITNLSIASTKLEIQSEDFDVLSLQSLIYLECQLCILDQIEIIRDFGLPEIRIVNSQNVLISNSIFTQNQLQIKKILNSDIDCYTFYQQKLMQYFILIQYYQNITIDSLIINSTFVFNNPVILIQGLDFLSNHQNEKVQISNSQFLENMIIVSSQTSLASIFTIYSSQDCAILFNNLTFNGNHLNSINEQTKIEISTTLLILVIKANVVITNCKFYQNIITNSSSSMLDIKARSVEITNSTFEKTNILNFQKLAKNIMLDAHIITTNQLSNAFLIKSQGGSGKFQVSRIIINKVFVNQSSSACGGTFYIQTINDATISITNSYFESSSTVQDFIIETTYGGLLYIDSSYFQLNFSMINCSIEKSFSRTLGGSIYINASAISNQMIFKKLIIKNIFSQQGTFLFCQNIFSKSVTNIFIEEINFSNSKDGFYQFLSTLKKLTYYEAYKIFLQSSIFDLKNVNFTIKSSQFQADQSLNIAYIEDLYDLNLIDMYIGQSFFSSPMFYFFLQKDYNGIVHLQNISIVNMIEIETNGTSDQCLETDDNQPLIFSCQNEDKEANNIQIQENIIQVQKNQLICNLQVSHFNFQFIPAIIGIFQFYQQRQFLATNIIFRQVICISCYYGLITLTQAQQKSENNIYFEEVNIYNCVCGNEACLQIIADGLYDSDILLKNLLGQRRLTQLQDNIILRKSVQFQAIFTHCNFYKNQGKFGGGILVAGINTLISFCTFQQNKADIGGAIYTINLDTNTYIYKCQFTLNTALIAGGIFLNKQPIQYTNNSLNIILDNNSTYYGNNIVEIPVSLALSFNDGNIVIPNNVISSNSNSIMEYAIITPYKIFGKKEDVQTLYYPSGQQIGSYLYIMPNSFYNIHQNLTFRIIALNSFNEKQNIIFDSNCTLSTKIINRTSQLELYEYQGSLSYYTMKFSSATGDYNLDDLIIEFNPYYAEEIVLRIFITSDAIKIPIYDTAPPYLIKKFITNYTLFVDVKTFPCQAGEFFNSKNGACFQCDVTQFQYQVKQNSTKCEFKDDEKIDSITSSMIQLKQSFWRPFYYSQIIEKCDHLVGNCMGGWIAGATSCYKGHIGALCEQCDLYNTRGDGSYSIESIYKCGSCNKIQGNVFSIFFISLWTLFSIFLSVNSQNVTNEKFSAAKRLRMLNVKCILKDPSTAVLIKIFTNYLQIISTLQTFQLQVPDGLTNFIQTLGTPLEQMAYSLDCFLISITNISIIYFRVIWSLNMAFMYIFVFFIIFYLLLQMKFIKYDITYVSSALIYIFIFLQPNIIKELIALASFRTISEVNWIQANVAYQYDTESHSNWLKYLCLPVFIVLALIIPCFLFFNIFKNRKQLENIYSRKVWGYLYNEYKVSAYYWEFIKLFQKDFIVIVLAYYDDFIPIKASLVFLCIFTYSLITTYESPYLTGELNRLDVQSITVCAVSIILGSSIYLAQQNGLQEIIWQFYFVISILNLFLFIKLVIQIIFAYFEKIYDSIEKFKEILLQQQKTESRYYPFLKKLFESRKSKKQRIKARFEKIKQFLIYEAKQIIKQKHSYQMMAECVSQHQRYSLIQQNQDYVNPNQRKNLKLQFL